MRQLSFALAIALATFGAGCSKSDDASAAPPANDKGEKADKASELPTMTIDEVATQIAAKQVQAVDCNHDMLRKKVGVVPGAIRVSPDSFAASELPADKTAKLVFYCSDPG